MRALGCGETRVRPGGLAAGLLGDPHPSPPIGCALATAASAGRNPTLPPIPRQLHGSCAHTSPCPPPRSEPHSIFSAGLPWGRGSGALTQACLAGQGLHGWGGMRKPLTVPTSPLARPMSVLRVTKGSQGAEEGKQHRLGGGTWLGRTEFQRVTGGHVQ